MDQQLQLLQNDVLETESHIVYIITRTRKNNQAQFYTQSNKKTNNNQQESPDTGYADFLLAGSQHNLYDTYLLCVQYQTPDDRQKTCPKHVEFYFKNKFENLVHLVSFIIRIYHDARSYECQKLAKRLVDLMLVLQPIALVQKPLICCFTDTKQLRCFLFLSLNSYELKCANKRILCHSDNRCATLPCIQ